MKTLLILLSFVLSVTGTVKAGFGVQEAFNLGHISVSGISSSGYSEAKLIVKNLRSYDVDVDFSTACFVQDNASQRIGLSYEKGTGKYYLRLSAKETYTLYFSSRCLDHYRSAPTTGVSFAKIVNIKDFPEIIEALRDNYTQAGVWEITNGTGSVAERWRDADVRSHPPGTVDLSGAASWASSGSTINIKVDKVKNLSTTAKTGSLRLRIWATRSKYTGGSINGYVMGTRKLDPLRPLKSHKDVNGQVNYSRPPAGTYYTTLTVEEKTSSGWVVRDYINFNNKKTF